MACLQVNQAVHLAKEQGGFPEAAPALEPTIHRGGWRANIAIVRVGYIIMPNTMLAMTSTIPPPRREEICA